MEQVDVLVVGAGVSGIGAAYYLQRDHPERSYAVLEARAASGGTWDLFRYPGVRSDSDLHTFGYEFAPWRDERAIADGPAILDYVRRTAAEHGIEDRIRYGHRVLAAAWSTTDARWRVEVEHGGERTTIGCAWLFGATGYYRYDEGFAPEFPGRDRFAGTVVHPQHWPADLDVTGRRVVVVGSGATAVTLVPALAGTAARVTMLQRTPSYVLPVPAKDGSVNRLRRLLGDERAHTLVRRKNIVQQQALYRFCRARPALARRVIRWVNARELPDGYPVDEHFRPPYDPWDQRLCIVPDGDLFRVLRAGTAEIVTDRIETFTETGIRLASGRELPADVVVTATGLTVLPFGGIELTVDGAPVHLPDTVAYKGVMLSGVPNFAYAIGYTNASWTLKVGLLCEHWTRVLSYMDGHGYDVCVPELPDAGMSTRPLLDFGAGYVQRAMGALPRQGDRDPWLTSMSYRADVRRLRTGPVEDEHLRFERAAVPA